MALKSGMPFGVAAAAAIVLVAPFAGAQDEMIGCHGPGAPVGTTLHWKSSRDGGTAEETIIARDGGLTFNRYAYTQDGEEKVELQVFYDFELLGVASDFISRPDEQRLLAGAPVEPRHFASAREVIAIVYPDVAPGVDQAWRNDPSDDPVRYRAFILLTTDTVNAGRQTIEKFPDSDGRTDVVVFETDSAYYNGTVRYWYSLEHCAVVRRDSADEFGEGADTVTALTPQPAL